MKNPVTIVLILSAIVCTASVAYSEPVDYTYSTMGHLPLSDPLLAGLTLVTGTFVYENGDAPSLHFQTMILPIQEHWCTRF